MGRCAQLHTWRLAGWPTRRSPSVNATTEGVVRAPSEFSITRGCEPSITATHEFVVPRSIPITEPRISSLQCKVHESEANIVRRGLGAQDPNVASSARKDRPSVRWGRIKYP